MLRKTILALTVVLVVTGAAVTQVAAVPGVTAQQEAPDEADTAFTVDSLTAPDSAAPGSNVTVVAAVSNDGDERQTESVEFRVGGDVVDRTVVTLGAGESAAVELSANTEGLAPGTYQHGVFTDSDGAVAEITLSESFTLDSLDAPASAAAGDNTTVSATVTNPNDFEPPQPVTFRLGGAPLASEDVTLAGGATETVTFNVSTDGLEPGDYVHGVFTRDAGQFADITVEEPGPTEASAAFDDQESDGTTVTVQNVTVPSDGYVAIHDSTLLDGNVIGSVVGVSEYLEEGQYGNVTIELFNVEGAEFNETELSEDQTLIAMPHEETTDNEVYEFVSSNGTEDGAFTVNGEPVTDPAAVTVATDDNGTEEPTETEDEETEAPATTES